MYLESSSIILPISFTILYVSLTIFDRLNLQKMASVSNSKVCKPVYAPSLCQIDRRMYPDDAFVRQDGARMSRDDASRCLDDG
jgi:hypothetical protein